MKRLIKKWLNLSDAEVNRIFLLFGMALLFMLVGSFVVSMLLMPKELRGGVYVRLNEYSARTTQLEQDISFIHQYLQWHRCGQ